MDNFTYKNITEIVGQIKNHLTIEDYITKELLIPLKYYGTSPKVGARLSTPCPIHGGTRNGSFFVLPEHQIFRCFGCQAKGDIVRFAELYRNARSTEKWSYVDALNYFSKRFGISHELTEKDLANRIFEEYIQSLNHIWNNNIQIDSTNFNFAVTLECKKVLTKNSKFFQVRNVVENIYKVSDEAIIKFDSTDLKESQKAKDNMSIIQAELLDKLKLYSSNIDGLRNSIESLNIKNRQCSSCYLRYSCNKVVVGEGNFLSKIMIIGEAPGQDEDETGRPFVGSSGKFLREAIRECGFNDEDLWIDNISKCKPNQNKFQSKEAIICKTLWLDKMINIIKPKFIMLMGANASKTYLELNSIKISDYIGKVLKKDGIELWFNFHPSFIIREGRKSSQNYETFKSLIDNFLNLHVENNV